MKMATLPMDRMKETSKMKEIQMMLTKMRESLIMITIMTTYTY